MAIMVGLSTGGTFLLMVLSASASYIAVPAAMRLALTPEIGNIPIPFTGNYVSV